MSNLTDEILVSPTDAELALAVEGNLFALFRAMLALPDSEIAEWVARKDEPRTKNSSGF